jgi:Pyruvate/2-oxoacid:ferredoxin oxidoreductase delta subunit
MIHVTQTLCEGCGICVEGCPTGAITLVDDKARVDLDLCDGCGSLDETHDKVCIDLCPNNALSWVADSMPERPTEASSLVIVDPRVKVIPAPKRAPMPWYRAAFPAVGGALMWVGREIVPRLAPLALDVLDSALDRRVSRWSRDEAVTPEPRSERKGKGKRKRRRHRGGR